MKNGKMMLTALLAAALAWETAGFALADEPPLAGAPEITVNGETVELADSLPERLFEENGQVMVPLRAVAEKMGYTVLWNGEDQSVRVVNGSWEARLTIGEDSYTGVNNDPEMAGLALPQHYGAAPQLIEGTTYAPAQMFVLLGWENESVGQFLHFKPAAAAEKEPAAEPETAEENEPVAGMPNPFTEYDNPAALTEQMGFPMMEIGALPEDITETVYIGSNFGLAQVLYLNEDGECLRLRQEKGNGDISGDYNDYPKVKTVTPGAVTYTLKGGAEGYYLALWEDQGYAFSLSSEEAVSEVEIMAYIDSLYVRE